MLFNSPLPEYQCPFCKNPFWGSETASYSVYSSIFYSDGTQIGTYGIPLHSHLRITRCPKCKKFFEQKYLEERRIAEDDRNDAIDPTAFCRGLPKKDRLYGTINGIGSAYGSESRNRGLFFAQFWKDALSFGLSFPAEPSEEERKFLQKQMVIHLWQAYHRPLPVSSNCPPNTGEAERKRQADTWFGIGSLKTDHPEMKYFPQIDTEKYLLFCKQILPYFQTKKDKDLLILSELYRNLSEFDKCIQILKKIKNAEKYSFFVDGIRLAAEQGISKTVQIT